MGYSITFGEGSATRNTYTNWNLLPESPPVVPPPTPKTNYVEIPGRQRGPLDMTRVPFNRVTYERISGSWTFVLFEDYWHTANPKTTYETVRSWLHGRSTKMVLEEDPNHYFLGRFTVEPPNRTTSPFVMSIGYSLEPVRYNTDGSIDSNWVRT